MTFNCVSGVVQGPRQLFDHTYFGKVHSCLLYGWGDKRGGRLDPGRPDTEVTMSGKILGQGAGEKAGQVVDGSKGTGGNDLVLPWGVSPDLFGKIMEKITEGFPGIGCTCQHAVKEGAEG